METKMKWLLDYLVNEANWTKRLKDLAQLGGKRDPLTNKWMRLIDQKD